MRCLPLASAASLATCALLAISPVNLVAAPQQTASQRSFNSTSEVIESTALSCPITFFAQRQSPSVVVNIGGGKPPVAGQGLHLTLRHPDRSISSAEVIVNAASNRARVLPVSPQSSAPDIARTFHLAGDGKLRESDLWIDGAGSILSADIVSITWADGTVWRRSATHTCHAVPSGYLLIGSR